MSIGDLPLVGALKTKMRWNQARQRLLAENVANADTPQYRGRDLKAPRVQSSGLRPPNPPSIAVATTAAGHIQGRPIGGAGFRDAAQTGFETTPNGNAVNLEEEMMKAAENQIEYQAVTSLYQRSLGVIRTAIGKKG
ncbi:flagellar basal body rod protein FlgB [Prosthecomicrobium sp. N25]|uniref:flagellar basal body rod protein FlgB n=1 Tax=Prosthecomicrobium sp. N25 TaxID=3129254 RepID=UPI003077A2E9